MDAAALNALQAPLKDKYREAPEAAVVTLKAEGRIGEGGLPRRDRQGAPGGGAAPGHRRSRHAGLLGRHAG